MVGIIVWSLNETRNVSNKYQNKRTCSFFFFFFFFFLCCAMKKTKVVVLLLCVLLVGVECVWKFEAFRMWPLRDCVNESVGDHPRFLIDTQRSERQQGGGPMNFNHTGDVAMVDFFEAMAMEFTFSDQTTLMVTPTAMTVTTGVGGLQHFAWVPAPLITKSGANSTTFVIGQTCGVANPFTPVLDIFAKSAVFSNQKIVLNVTFAVALNVPLPPATRRKRVVENTELSVVFQLQRPFLDLAAVSAVPALPIAPPYNNFLSVHQPSATCIGGRLLAFRGTATAPDQPMNAVCRDLLCSTGGDLNQTLGAAPTQGPIALLPDGTGSGWHIGFAGPNALWTTSIACGNETTQRQIVYVERGHEDSGLLQCEVESVTRTLIPFTQTLAAAPDSAWSSVKVPVPMWWAVPYVFENDVRVPLGVRKHDNALIWGHTNTTVNISVAANQYADALVFDWDRDGVMDLLFYGPLAPSQLYLGAPNHSFVFHFQFGQNFVSVFASDINGDGRLDLLTSHNRTDVGLIFLTRGTAFVELPRAATVFQAPIASDAPTFVANLREPFVLDWVGLATTPVSWVVFGNPAGQARFLRLRLADTSKWARIRVTMPDRNDVVFTHVIFDPANQNDDSMMLALPQQWRVDIAIFLMPSDAQVPLMLCGVSPYSRADTEREVMITSNLTLRSALDSIEVVNPLGPLVNLASVIQFDPKLFRASDRLLLAIDEGPSLANMVPCATTSTKVVPTAAMSPYDLANRLLSINFSVPATLRFCITFVSIRFERGCSQPRQWTFSLSMSDESASTATTAPTGTTAPAGTTTTTTTTAGTTTTTTTTTTPTTSTPTTDNTTLSSAVIDSNSSTSTSATTQSASISTNGLDVVPSSMMLASWVIPVAAGVGGGVVLLLLIALIAYAVVRMRKNRWAATNGRDHTDAELQSRERRASSTPSSGEYGQFPPAQPEAAYGQSQFSDLK
jgi:hypothetical protein